MYSAHLQGYIADVPEFWFKRIDGRVYHYNKLSQCSANPTVNFMEVNGGWSLYPAAYLPSASTLEVSMTSAEFRSDLFELATGSDFQANSTFKYPVTETLTVADSTLTLSKAAATDSVKINGMTETGNTPTTGTYKVTTSGDTTTVTLYASDFSAGDKVVVNYEVVDANAITLKTKNDRAAIGEVILRWPVYNGGENVVATDNDSATAFAGAAIIGYIWMKIYRGRITQMPGFDTSYKTAATNQITIGTMDPEAESSLTGGNAYEISFQPAAAE